MGAVGEEQDQRDSFNHGGVTVLAATTNQGLDNVFIKAVLTPEEAIALLSLLRGTSADEYQKGVASILNEIRQAAASLKQAEHSLVTLPRQKC
jgi:hypothetical protein